VHLLFDDDGNFKRAPCSPPPTRRSRSRLFAAPQERCCFRQRLLLAAEFTFPIG